MYRIGPIYCCPRPNCEGVYTKRLLQRWWSDRLRPLLELGAPAAGEWYANQLGQGNVFSVPAEEALRAAMMGWQPRRVSTLPLARRHR